MNALNILSGKSTPITSRSRTASVTDLQDSANGETQERERESVTPEPRDDESDKSSEGPYDDLHTEKTPLMHDSQPEAFTASPSAKSWRLVPKRIADALVTSAKVVLSTVAAPVLYVVACFYDEQGYFSAILPIRRVYNVSSRKKRRKSAPLAEEQGSGAIEDERGPEKPRLRPKEHDEGMALSASGSDVVRKENPEASQSSDKEDGPAQNTRSKSAQPEEIAPAKRSIRIKLHNDASEKRRHRSHKSIDISATAEDDRVSNVANSLKSPSSPTFAPKLKYPRLPAPPRPLVPRRQPSYITTYHHEPPRKTLVIDLDETLIHSMAKSNRMSTGHMVEVKFQGPVSGSGLVLGPQVPILYFVHERPHCHEFLRKVSKWYNLIVFTASVQEYADPVIDWLERERAYFSGRYYRQHCTFRNGAYIKDLSQVEPDLSRVMILDNSPMSYIFHEDNAIPIEGWISDPSDSDLLHLVPFLEGLQFATDVRALLALRLGQAERT